MNSQTLLNTPQDDELSFWYIVNFIKEGWRWLVGGVALGLVCALAVLLVTPKQYEATALFQGAKVLGGELDSSGHLIERLKFPTFYGSDQLKSCDVMSSEPIDTLAKKVNALVLKGTNIVQLSYRARDGALAVRCLEAITDRVIAVQNQQSKPLLENAKKHLELTKQQLSDAERLQSALEKQSMNSLNVADTKFSQAVLLMSTSLTKKDQIASLRQSVLDQLARLEPPATQPAGLIEPIYGPVMAVFPKKLPMLIGGLFGGLVLGGLGYFMRRSWLLRRPR